MKNIPLYSSPSKYFNNKGFTLVEMMVVVAISMIVLGGIVLMYVKSRGAITAQEQVVEMQQSIRAALDIMENEVRMAGYDPRGTVGAGFIPPAALPATNTYANSLNFTMVADTDGIDNNGVGGTDEVDEFETVEYYVYDSVPAGDGSTALGRRTPVSVQAVAENIHAVEFNYTLDDGTQTTAPTAAQLPNIRAVEISILARAGRADSDYTYNERNAANVLLSYIPGSGNLNWDINGATAGTGNPPVGAQSHFRRRLLITTVQCRNMGL